MSTTTELHRKDAELQAVRAELVALRESVQALSERWDATAGDYVWPTSFLMQSHAMRLRHILRAES